MAGKRTLRKLEAMCTHNTDVYECNCCLWLAYVRPSTSFEEVEIDFKVHECNENSLSQILSATSKA
jgi:hypothetical protein